MNIQQITYVVEIYKTGSISQAAKNLFASQPNISSALKKLEQELGFPILVRTKNGISFTGKGVDFVRHGRYILEHIQQISELSSDDGSHRFSLVAPWYPPAEYAYIRLCLEYEKKQKINFNIQSANLYEATALVHEHTCDIAIITSINVSTHLFRQEMESKKMKYVHLHSLQCNVNLCAKHPLLEKEPFDFDLLWQYPYVKYRDPNRQEPSNTLPFVNPDKIIVADSRDARSQLVSTSTAYSIGLPLPPKRMDELNLVSIPLPGGILDLGYVVSADQHLNPIAQRYLQLLEEEMLFLKDRKIG